MNRPLTFAIGLFLLAGCTPQAARPAAEDDAALAAKAKAALVELARATPPVFLEGLDADRLAAIPLTPGDLPHMFYLGAFQINVEKHYYSADIGGPAWQQWYHGTFTVDASGRWTANKPIVTFADR